MAGFFDYLRMVWGWWSSSGTVVVDPSPLFEATIDFQTNFASSLNFEQTLSGSIDFGEP